MAQIEVLLMKGLLMQSQWSEPWSAVSSKSVRGVDNNTWLDAVDAKGARAEESFMCAEMGAYSGL